MFSASLDQDILEKMTKPVLKKFKEALAILKKNNLVLSDPCLIRKGASNMRYIAFKCECGEEVQTPLVSFHKRKAYFCLKCAPLNAPSQRIPDDIKFKSHGLTLISTVGDSAEFKNSYFTVSCSQGHQFTRKGSKFYKGNWKCPKCTHACCSLEEEYVRTLLQEHFGEQFKNVRPDWLLSTYTGYALELDMYSADLRLAFEYNGKHHYEPIYGEERFLITQRNDLEKARICNDMNVQLITIPYVASHYSIQGFYTHIVAFLKTVGIYISDEEMKKAESVVQQLNLGDLISHKRLKTKKAAAYQESHSIHNYSCPKCHFVHTLLVRIHNADNVAKDYIDSCPFCSKSVAVTKHRHLANKFCDQLNLKFAQFKYQNKNTHFTINGFVGINNQGEEIHIGKKIYQNLIRQLQATT